MTTDRETTLFVMDLIYLFAKQQACKRIYRMLVENKELFQKLEKLAGDSRLIQVAIVFGRGNDGTGYFISEMVLNLKNCNEQDWRFLLYIAARYVPKPDTGHTWEFEELQKHKKRANFFYAYKLMTLYNGFQNDKDTLANLEQLSQRRFNTCVEEKKEHVIAYG